MKRSAVSVAVLALLLAAPGAGAVMLVTPGGQVAQPYQRWADHSKVPTPTGTVVVRRDYCSTGWDKCYDPATRTIYLAPGWVERGDFLHELGHDFDARVMTGAARNGFLKIMGLRPPWVTSDPHGDRGAPSPNELFADAWAICALHRTITFWTLSSGWAAAEYDPTPRQHRRVCALVRRSATSTPRR